MCAPKPPSAWQRFGHFSSTLRHLQRRTASSASTLTWAGESLYKEIDLPRSSMSCVALTTCHPNLCAETTKAPPGPRTRTQGCALFDKSLIALDTKLASMAEGSHELQTASAQAPIGWLCAAKAGSAWPFAEPSIMVSVMSRSPAPAATTDAATALR